MSTQYPLARKDKLVVREVADEVLVYDLTRNKAFCLNRVAGAVWKLSDGQKAASQIADELSEELGATIGEDAVWSAIDQLGRDHLLEYCIPMPTSAPRVTRRQQLKSLGRAAAIAGPVVLALSVPTAGAAATCPLRHAGASCQNNGDCCSNVCSGNQGNKTCVGG